MVDPQAFGHQLHRLAPALQQQPPQIQSALDPLTTPGQGREHLGRELLQPTPPQRKLPSPHANRELPTPVPCKAHNKALLVTGATDLPTLLVIDSPRKNVGYGTDDQQLISRFYAHFLEHITAVRQGATVVRPSQVIIVDNDLPAGFRDRLHVIELSRENPLVL
ncbi:hypothetical protein [Kitasatospora sp. NPDC088548]|uniref:hypothetical protein n=1 Tax=Kitasatospora sp. NPDC088548 TaxID=3364075 RepID=UPI0038156E40